MNVWLKTLSVKRLDTLIPYFLIHFFILIGGITQLDLECDTSYTILHLNIVKAVALRLHHSSTHSPHQSIVY